jgi:hypothetical protein
VQDPSDADGDTDEGYHAELKVQNVKMMSRRAYPGTMGRPEVARMKAPGLLMYCIMSKLIERVLALSWRCLGQRLSRIL